jgi:hypothetical protein
MFGSGYPGWRNTITSRYFRSMGGMGLASKRDGAVAAISIFGVGGCVVVLW